MFGVEAVCSRGSIEIDLEIKTLEEGGADVGGSNRAAADTLETEGEHGQPSLNRGRPFDLDDRPEPDDGVVIPQADQGDRMEGARQFDDNPFDHQRAAIEAPPPIAGLDHRPTPPGDSELELDGGTFQIDRSAEHEVGHQRPPVSMRFLNG